MKLSMIDGQTLISRFWARIPKHVRIAFFSTFIMGLMIHLYMLTNKFPNHDEMLFTFSNNAGLEIAGRWFLGVLSAFGSDFSLPWVNGVIAIIALSLSSALIVSVMQLTKPIQAFLVSFALVSFPTVGNTFSFMFTADGYFLGLLLAVVGVFVLDRFRFGFLISAVLFTLSLGTYQAYICFAIALMAMKVLKILIVGSNSNRAMGVILLRYVASLAIAAVLYIAITKGILWLTNQQMTDYIGLNKMGQMQIADLPSRIYMAYYQFFNFLFVRSGRYSSIWLSIAHLVCGMITTFGLVRLLIKGPKRTRLQSTILIIVIVLIPLLFNFIYLTNADLVHDLMTYAISCLYILAMLTWSLSDELIPNDKVPSMPSNKAKTVNALISWVVIITVLFSSLSWSVYTNQGYFTLQTKYENLYALCERIVDRIETDPLYTVGMPVAVLGAPDDHYPSTKFYEYKTLDFATGFGSEYDYEYLRSDIHFHEFVRVYLGVSFEKIDTNTVIALKDTKEFKEMPSFPYSGCIAIIDDILVVKMGDGNRYGWQ